MTVYDGETGLFELINRGGVLYQVPGNTPAEALGEIIDTLRLPPSIRAGELLQAVLEREALMSTALGHGIALPHPRNPLVAEAAEQFAAIAFLRQPIDWNALDRLPVHTVILIVSASAKLHLHTLSRINFFCQQEDFRTLLANRASPEAIIKVLQDAEETWK
jgi:PTS system nitrogen regulatory IIA component